MRRVLRNTLFALVTTLAFFGLAEGVLRLAFPIVRTATLPNDVIRQHLHGTAFRYDPDLYWTWKDLPGPDEPAGGEMQINHFGFRRVQPMTKAKPAGVTRVFTFGDSQTLGAGVGPDETYSAYAESALGEGWEVINAGISGYRTLNVYRLLRLKVGDFDPDVILIDCMPFDSPRDDGPLAGRAQGGLARQLRGLLFESHVYYTLRLVTGKLRPDRARWLDQTGAGLTRGREGLGNHDLIAEWARDHGVTPVFMTYPVTNENWAYDCHTREGELPEGVPVFDACEVVGRSGRPGRELYQDRNHLTAEGNQLVGEALAEFLRGLELE
ncbi:MAG: SGNH/GDSL hydrolase family protein [Alphaproteobacteria bacterium]|nr:SGNH/GDSL hydrolase family protein [Alphaproteobacteria bacterium]